MIGQSDWFAETFGAFPDGGIDLNTKAAEAIIRAGLGLVLIVPEGKRAACTLTASQAASANKAAREDATARGATNTTHVSHDCGIKHVVTDADTLKRTRPRQLLGSGANLAVAPGKGSRPVIVVDVDTAEQRRGFLETWESQCTLPEVPWGAGGESLAMTVSSPGVMDTSVDGEPVWTHKDGGHYWFEVPEGVELPERPGKLTGCPHGGGSRHVSACSGRWTAYWNEGYVLVPPSVRPEGAYRLTGSIHSAPAWLLDAIQELAERTQAGKLVDRLRAPGDTVDDWASVTSWSDLLTDDGWSAYATDTCGCPTFTRPGDAVHEKSATGHEPGCTMYDTSMGHGPLHIWSDAVDIDGRRTVSKLSYVAHTRFGGNTTAAMSQLGIDRTVVGDSIDDDWEAGLEGLIPDPKGEAVRTDGPSSGGVSESDGVRDSWAPTDLSAYLDPGFRPPEAELMPRTDGVFLLYPGKIHSVHGEPESGKSFILQAEAVRLIGLGRDVCWLDFDSDPSEVIPRLVRMGARPDDILAHFHYRQPEAAPTAGSEGWRDMFSRPYALAVLDGVTDALSVFGAETNGNDDITGLARKLLRLIVKYTGATVVLIDHVVKDAEKRGRWAIGAQAKMAVLSGASYTVDVVEPMGRGQVGQLVLRVGKDRPGGVRPHCGRMRVTDRTQEAARITVDDTGLYTVLTIDPPRTDPMVSDDVQDAERDRDMEAIKARIREFLKDNPNVSRNVIEKNVSGKATTIRAVLEVMASKGEVQVSLGRNKTLLHSVRPALEAGENHDPYT